MKTFVLAPDRPMARGERRAFRKENRLCLECGKPLTKADARRQLCAKHAAANRKSADAWRSRNPDKAALYARTTNDRQKANREHRNKVRRAYYLAHKISDEHLCVCCPRKAAPDSLLCRKHRDRNRRASRDYRRRLKKKQSAIPSSP